jgi:ribonuclease BN (tRNA processing enzyme)
MTYGVVIFGDLSLHTMVRSGQTSQRAFLRFGQSPTKISDLSVVVIGHLHPDDVSDLPGISTASNEQRQAPLPIVGPSGNESAPDFVTFPVFRFTDGAFQVFGGALGGPSADGGGGRAATKSPNGLRMFAWCVQKRQELRCAALYSV